MSAVSTNLIAQIGQPPAAAHAVDLQDFNGEEVVPSAVGDMWVALRPSNQPSAAAANDEYAGAGPLASESAPAETDPAMAAVNSAKRPQANLVREDRATMKYRRIIGPRLLQARESTGLGQQEAAVEIGYKTPAQLSQWELGRRVPPLSEIVKLADLYSCTVEFLLGRAAEMERDPASGLRNAMLRGVRRQLARCTEVVIDEIGRHASLVGTDSGSARGFVDAGGELLDAVQAFMRMNGAAFEEMRGGATVVARAEAFEKALHGARARMNAAQALDAGLRDRLGSLSEGDIDLGDEA